MGWGANNVLLLHPHRRVFSRMRSYVMGWGGGVGANNVLCLHSHRRVFLQNQRYVMLWMLRWLHICTLRMLRLFARLHATVATLVVTCLTEFGEDPTSLLAFCRREKMILFANIENTRQVETHVITMVWVRHTHHWNVILTCGEIWAVNLI